MTVPHRVCAACGHYDGRQVKKVGTDEAETKS
jgi:ribosomal protein L32